jgi:hypothetical protein
VTLTGDGRCLFRQRYLRGPKFLAQVCRHAHNRPSSLALISPFPPSLYLEQEKAGTERIGPRGVWTQAGGAGGAAGPWLANAGRIPANPLNTNVLVLEEGAKAGKVCGWAVMTA